MQSDTTRINRQETRKAGNSSYRLKTPPKGLINSFPLSWADSHRDDNRLANFDSFLQHYDEFDVDGAFAKYAAEKNVVRDTAVEASQPERVKHSDNYLHLVLKAQVARNLFGTEYYYRIMCAIDDGYQRAVKELKNRDR